VGVGGFFSGSSLRNPMNNNLEGFEDPFLIRVFSKEILNLPPSKRGFYLPFFIEVKVFWNTGTSRKYFHQEDSCFVEAKLGRSLSIARL